MTLPTATLQRLSRIKSGLLEGKTIAEIALDCRVYEKTIDRDLQKWRRSKEFEDWLKEEWVRLHLIIQQRDPTEAYRQLTKLMGQTITRKMKVEEKIDITERVEIVHLDVTEDEDSILNKAASILNKKLSEKKQPTKIH